MPLRLLTILALLLSGCAGSSGNPPHHPNMHAPSSLVYQQKLFIAAPAARVWEAITTPDLVAQYHLCPLQVIELKPGGRLVYGVGDQPFITGTIIEVVPEQKLVHSFRFDAKTHAHVENDDASRVTYSIKPMGAMCELTFTHDQFATDNQTYANVTGGWPAILSGLKTLVETGKPLPWPEPDEE